MKRPENQIGAELYSKYVAFTNLRARDRWHGRLDPVDRDLLIAYRMVLRASAQGRAA